MNKQQPDSTTFQESIPWWQGLDAAILAELKLSSVREVPLEFMDVVVIGAGVAGLSAALGVKQRASSARVLVLEKEYMLGFGATGRNAGILTPGINVGVAELPPGSSALSFWPETTSMFHKLIEEAAVPGTLLMARKTGALSLAGSAREARKLEHEAQARITAGLRAEVWPASRVSELTQGRLNVQSIKSTLWLPDEGRIHPLSLLAHLARRVRKEYRVPIAGQASVSHYEEVEIDHGHYWRLMLANGTTILARGLIRCVGPTAQTNARIYALAFAVDLPDTFPVFWDSSSFTYADYRPGDGRLGVSGGRYGKAGTTRYDGVYYKRLVDATRHWLPELAEKEPVFTWAVDLAVKSDMIPEMRILGAKAPGAAVEGLGALGVLPGMLLGQRAGAWMADRLSV